MIHNDRPIDWIRKQDSELIRRRPALNRFALDVPLERAVAEASGYGAAVIVYVEMQVARHAGVVGVRGIDVELCHGEAGV